MTEWTEWKPHKPGDPCPIPGTREGNYEVRHIVIDDDGLRTWETKFIEAADGDVVSTFWSRDGVYTIIAYRTKKEQET